MPVTLSTFGNSFEWPCWKMTSRSITMFSALRSATLLNGAFAVFSHRAWMPRPAGIQILWFFGSLLTYRVS